MQRQNKIQPHGAQSNLLLLDKLHPKSTSNHLSVAVTISGPIDIAAFRSAFHLLVTRHEMLRAVVGEDNSGLNFYINPTQEIYSSQQMPLEYADLTIMNINAYSPPTIPNIEDFYLTLSKINKEDFITQPFNHRVDPLWRAMLIKVAENTYQFSMIFSHTIIDEKSRGILFKDLSALYNNIVNQDEKNALIPLPSLGSVKLDINPVDTKQRLKYWKEKLSDLNNINLQTDALPQKAFRFQGKRQRFTLDSELISRIQANYDGHSLNQIFIASLYTLLHRYSDETDICIGITSANRKHENADAIDALVNCFFNSIPLRIQFTKDTTFLDLLDQVKKTQKEALVNQLPLDIIVQNAISSNTKSTLRTASPFSIMLVFNEEKPTLTLGKTEASYPIELDLGCSKFPYFGFGIDKYPDGSCKCFIEYNSDLFNLNTINRIISHYTKTLQFIAENPRHNISIIPLLLEEEKILIDKLNATEKKSESEMSVPEFFHKRSLEYPDEPFVIYHDENLIAERLTYKQVDSLSSQLANHLIQQNIVPNTEIGICMQRSPRLIVAMLAVYKAGGVVLTIENEHCPKFFLKTNRSDTAIILIDDHTKSLFSDINKPLINLQDNMTATAIQSCKIDYPAVALKPEDPAYIMYTSGTSGEIAIPKGVKLPHGGFSNLLYALHEDHGLKPFRTVYCSAQKEFDAFLFDILVALASDRGQFHFTFEAGRFSPKVVNTVSKNEGLNYIVLLANLLNTYDPQLPYEDVISMGAPPNEMTMQLWKDARLNRVMWNGFGVTEASICLCLYPYKEGTDPNVIGTPIRNMQIFILNPNNLSLCPIGVPGEMYIAGPGVALGYIDNEKANAEKFITVYFDREKAMFFPTDDNSGNRKQMRLYATGDYCCYQLQNDNTVAVKYMHRKDKQIKINGVRLELDVLEKILRMHPLINDIALIPNKNLTGLSAYIVPSTNGLQAKEIRQQVRQYLSKTFLPSVCFPKNIEILKEMPITSNGKVDTRALQSYQTIVPGMIFREPLTDTQTKIRKIWSNVLDIKEDQIDINESFQDLGGTSIAAANIERRLNKILPLISEIDINILSGLMTIKSLSEDLKPLLIAPVTQSRLAPNVYLDGTYDVIFKSKKASRGSTPERRQSPSASSEDINHDSQKEHLDFQ